MTTRATGIPLTGGGTRGTGTGGSGGGSTGGDDGGDGGLGPAPPGSGPGGGGPGTTLGREDVARGGRRRGGPGTRVPGGTRRPGGRGQPSALPFFAPRGGGLEEGETGFGKVPDLVRRAGGEGTVTTLAKQVTGGGPSATEEPSETEEPPQRKVAPLALGLSLLATLAG